MRIWLVVSAALVVVGTLLCEGAGVASGADPGGQNSWTGSSVSGGQVAVQAGQIQVSPSTSSTTSKGNTPAKSQAPNPDVCTYSAAAPQDQALLGIGGATPGEWVVFACPGTAVNGALPLQWLPTAQAVPAVDPQALAKQAESKLALTSPTIEMAPPAGTTQLVNVASWLWIQPGTWQAMTATAAAGTVVATATAAPSKVVWNMGDGDVVTCSGPGTSYSASNPNAATDCSYAWTNSSTNQPDGAYRVTATVYWQVSWTAAGAPGGGNFGQVAGPTTQVAVRVTESQAINTPSSSGN